MLRNDIYIVVWNKIEGELSNKMKKLIEGKLRLLAVWYFSQKMKLFNFDSDEDAEDIYVPSLKTADTGIIRYRCEVESDGDIMIWILCSGGKTRSELGIPTATVMCERLFLFLLSTRSGRN